MAKRCYKGTDNLLNYWRQVRNGSPCFSVWDKDPDNLIFAYCGEDTAEAEIALQDWVDSIASDVDSYNVRYTFKTHPEGTKMDQLKNSRKTLINCDFSPNENYSAPASVVSGTRHNGNDYISMQLQAIESKLKALEEKKIDEEDESDEGPEEGAGWLGAIQSPAGQQLVSLGAILLERLTDRILPPKTEGKIITNLAGIPDDDSTNKAAALQYVDVLMKKGVTLDHLRKLAEMPGIKIKALLAML